MRSRQSATGQCSPTMGCNTSFPPAASAAVKLLLWEQYQSPIASTTTTSSQRQSHPRLGVLDTWNHGWHGLRFSLIRTCSWSRDKHLHRALSRGRGEWERLLLLEMIHRADSPRLLQLTPGSGDSKKESHCSLSRLEIRPATIWPHFTLRMMKLGS